MASTHVQWRASRSEESTRLVKALARLYEIGILKSDLASLKTIALDDKLKAKFGKPIQIEFQTPKTNFQKGGTSTALHYQKSFLTERLANYSKFISKPEESRKSCSRLSPYLAWGI